MSKAGGSDFIQGHTTKLVWYLYLLILRDILKKYFYSPLADTTHEDKFFADFNE